MRSCELYPNYGEVTVSLCSSTDLGPSSMQSQETARKFHCFLFSHILRAEVELKPKNPNGKADGYFVVLVKGNGLDVDYDAMKEAMSLENYRRSIEEDIVVTKNYVDFQRRKVTENCCFESSSRSLTTVSVPKQTQLW